MAITIEDFFRFGSKYPRLLGALFEVRDAIDTVGLRALIARHVDDDAPSRQTIEEQLLAYGILERAPYADTAFELRPEVRDLLAWILKRQELATADVIRGYLGQLSELMKELQAALDAADYPAAVHPLDDLDRTLEKIRAHADGNFETIATQVQELQSQRKEMTASERFTVINRIWNRMLVPLRDLIDDRGQIEQRFDRLTRTLVDLASGNMTSANMASGDTASDPIVRGQVAPKAVRQRARHTRARLARTRRVLSERHDDAVREVEPLYEQLRADSMLLEGASRMLKELRQFGASALDLDSKIGLEGWRPSGLISDEYLEARLVDLQGYEPEGDAMLAEPPTPVEYDPLGRGQVRQALAAACPIEDAFEFILEQWPERSLAELLRVFGWVHRGDFGPSQTPEKADECAYPTGTTTVMAWPVVLERVDS